MEGFKKTIFVKVVVFNGNQREEFISKTTIYEKES
jgi:hypothetical protein